MMWKLTDVERNRFTKLIESSCSKQLGNEILQHRIKLQNGIDGLTIEELLENDQISSDEVEAIYLCLPVTVEFYKFIDLLTVYTKLPTPEDEGKKAKYQAQIQRLRNKQENKEYLEMTKTINLQYGNNNNLMQDFGRDLRSINRQMIAVLNTLITVGGAFTFGFYGINLAYPSLGLDLGTRLILGLFFATIVLFADFYFLIKNME